MFQGEDVTLVGDFTGNWKEPLKAKFQGGSRHEVEVKLPQGKYVLNLLYFFLSGDTLQTFKLLLRLNNSL